LNVCFSATTIDAAVGYSLSPAEGGRRVAEDLPIGRRQKRMKIVVLKRDYCEIPLVGFTNEEFAEFIGTLMCHLDGVTYVRVEEEVEADASDAEG